MHQVIRIERRPADAAMFVAEFEERTLLKPFDQQRLMACIDGFLQQAQRALDL